MKYLKEIDALRGLAVISVIFYHAGFNLFKGGYIGVDIFFVISGYLITKIIYQEMNNNSFSFSQFYLRRARRILPALFFVILITIPFVWVLFWPDDFKNFFKSIIKVLLFVPNLYFYKEYDYFSTDIEQQPLMHIWSLGVEEQYYFIFPIILIFLSFGKRYLHLPILIGLFFTSLLFAQVHLKVNSNAVFYLTHYRFWELLLGSITAVCQLNCSTKLPEKIQAKLSFLSFIAIIFSIFSFDKTLPHPGVVTLIPTIATALIILYGYSSRSLSFIFVNKAFISLGLIS